MCFYFSKKVRLFSQNDVLFLFYFLINPAGTTVSVCNILRRNVLKVFRFFQTYGTFTYRICIHVSRFLV